MQPSGDRSVIVSFRIEHVLGWGVTVFLCLVPLILWLQIHPLATIHGFPGIMLAIGRVTGLIGMVMYALNLVYATRLRFLEYFFGGLNRVYIAHHVLGGFALIFLSLHPFFLALRFIKVSLLQAALLLLPNGLGPVSALFKTSSDYHNIVLGQWAIFLGIIAFWGMVILLLVTFFVKIPYRIWLFTHKFLGAAFFLAGLHVLFIASDTSTHTVLKVYILGLTLIGLAAFVYRTLLGRILIRQYRYFVEDVKVVAGNVTQVSMRPAGQKMSYKPGQFVFIRFLTASVGGGLSKEWHPFSVSSSPKEELLQLSVKGLGDYTNKLLQLQKGAAADIEGAYGRFTYTHFKNKNQIWVAGGIGITPFLSMARTLAEDDQYKVDLYYSVKTASELIDWEEVVDIAFIKKGNFRVFPFISDRENGARLSADYIAEKSGGVEGKDIFVCGPPAMMKSMRAQFKQKQVPGARIHSEEFAMS